MKISNDARLARERLDARFTAMRPVGDFARPVRGWIRAIRAALGMSSTQLAARLRVSQPAVGQLERSEERGTIELKTLQRVAEALDCTLIYALVPNQPLDRMVRNRMHAEARRQMGAVEHSMVLENQGLTSEQGEVAVANYMELLDSRRLWDDP